MRKPFLLIAVGITFITTGCVHYAYFQSPLHTNTDSYKSIPLQSEHMPAATYASGVFSVGGANDEFRDDNKAFIGSVYRSHNFGHFQGYYGLTGTVGSYKVKPYNYYNSGYYSDENVNDSLISARSGPKFYGAWGFNGGIDWVVPLKHESEWRALGIEVSWQHEFGEYLDFRKGLPDTAANLIARDQHYMTIALNTDLVFHIRNGSIGYKLGPVLSTQRLTGYYNKNGEPWHELPFYFSQTFHLTKNKFTGFWQINFGTRAINSQLGMSYQIGK